MAKRKKNNQGWRQWSHKQSIKYYLFLIIHYRALIQSKTKQGTGKFYKKMERWLCREKKSAQCRTHHMKCLTKYQSCKEIIYFSTKKYYEQRILPINHLLVEMNHHLTQLVERNVFSVTEKEESLLSTHQFIQEYPQLFKNQDFYEEKQRSSIMHQGNHELIGRTISPIGQGPRQDIQLSQVQQVQDEEVENISELYIEGDIDPDQFIN